MSPHLVQIGISCCRPVFMASRRKQEMKAHRRRLLTNLLFIESRSLIRTRRFRMLLGNALVLFVFGLIIITEEDQKYEFVSKLWICLNITSPVAVFGFLMFSKDGAFYNALCSKSLPIEQYVKAKILLLNIFVGLSCLLLCFFVAGIQRWLVFAAALYSSGIGVPLTVYVSSFDRRKIDYNRSAFFNYEGVSILKQFILIPPMLPMIFLQRFHYLGISLMFLSGLIGMSLLRFWIRVITKNLQAKKFLMLEGFRNATLGN